MMIGRRVVIAVKNLIGAMIKMVEEKISKLEANYEAMAAEIEKLKAKLAEKNETVWIPKTGDSYTYVDSDGIVEKDTIYYDNSVLYNDRINFNNMYHSDDKTQEHLEWYRDNVLRVQNRLMQLHELLCPDYFPDWDTDKGKWAISYDSEYKCFSCAPWYCMNYFIVCFTKEAAEKACEILNREKFMME